jgi:hypothetical protein
MEVSADCLEEKGDGGDLSTGLIAHKDSDDEMGSPSATVSQHESTRVFRNRFRGSSAFRTIACERTESV